jgi:2,4-dienoyl-CoA reductase-like NADH-dependent reductase (Old Yellow Enzyme family)
MAELFSALKIRSVTIPNRIGVSPMCQYSSEDGFVSEWHAVHYGSRAAGRAGLVFTEAAAVTPDGRISPNDLGVWSDAHVDGLARCVRFIREQGSVAGIQLAHAGRKASTLPPWQGSGAAPVQAGGWSPIWAPSALPFGPASAVPQALGVEQIRALASAFAAAAQRAHAAGFQVAEVHAAHGYLLHQFLSPLTNRRTDTYGGPFENRTRAVREVVAAVRQVWPEELPLFIRISATDWAEGGWDLEQSVALARLLKPLGVDLVDCSSGGLLPDVRIPVAPGYQVPFAERLRREAGVATAAVGLIREPAQAEQIVRQGQADLVLLGRQMLREPYWPQRAARELGAPVPHPIQYARAIEG